jgi:hypothetical protein
MAGISTAIRIRRRRLAGGLLLAGIPAAAGALAPDPPWHQPAYARRLVAEPGPLRSAPLLVVPPPGAGLDPEAGLVAVDPGGRIRPVDVVGTRNGAPALRVGPTDRSQGAWSIYYAPDPDTPPPRPLSPPAATPFRLDLRRFRVDSMPNTWERFRFMFHQARTAGAPALAGPGDPIGTGRTRGRRGAGPSFAAHLQGYVRIDVAGVHRFALGSEHPAWLQVNGEPVADAGLSPASSAESDDPGPPVFLPTGIHRFEIFAAISGQGAVALHWLPPGRETLEPFPRERIVAPDAAVRVRAEARHRTLYPDFTYTVEQAYAFRRLPGRFYEVQLVGASSNWLASDTRLAWQIGDAPATPGRERTHVFHRPGEHRVALHARDALGFTASIERTLDIPDLPPAMHDLSADLVGLPAVAFPDDPVAPRIRVVGRMPGTLRFRLEWTQWRADGTAIEGHADLAPGNAVVEHPLPAGAAGGFRRLHWRLLHTGAVLIEQETLLLTPPFDTLPHRAVGDALYDAQGRRLVLLPHRSRMGYRQPPLTQAQIFGHILLLDDALLNPGPAPDPAARRLDRELSHILDGPDLPIVHTASPAPWSAHPEAYGPLAVLHEATGLLRDPAPDLVVLSLGFRERAAGLHPRDFERRAAALSDLISTTLRRPVVWVTPPPGDPVEDSARAYAQAVRRVADARAMPVVDLFSAFMGEAAHGPAWMHAGLPSLTGEGHRRAAHLVARALLAHVQEAP